MDTPELSARLTGEQSIPQTEESSALPIAEEEQVYDLEDKKEETQVLTVLYGDTMGERENDSMELKPSPTAHRLIPMLSNK